MTSTTTSIFIGGAAALMAALLWSVAAILFKRLGKSIPPTELNIIKGTFAVSLMIITSLLLGETLPVISGFTLTMLMISGLVGIGIGDTAYFQSLNDLGPRLALLMGVLAPPMAGIISWVFLGEVLPLTSWGGILITLAGVTWVIMEENNDGITRPIHLKKGLWFAALASLSQAVGAVISRFALVESNISALQTAIVRLIAAIITLLLVILFSGKKNFAWLRTPNRAETSRAKLLGLIALVGMIGTYSAIWLQQVSLQYAPVGIAQTLLSTSPIFILPIALIRKEKVTWKTAVGVVIAITGVVILFGLS